MADFKVQFLTGQFVAFDSNELDFRFHSPFFTTLFSGDEKRNKIRFYPYNPLFEKALYIMKDVMGLI